MSKTHKVLIGLIAITGLLALGYLGTYACLRLNQELVRNAYDLLCQKQTERELGQECLAHGIGVSLIKLQAAKA